MGWIKTLSNLITIDMGTFIEEYLQDPSMAISSALEQLAKTNRFEQVGDDSIYEELATGEFKLYEEIIFSELSCVFFTALVLCHFDSEPMSLTEIFHSFSLEDSTGIRVSE